MEIVATPAAPAATEAACLLLFLAQTDEPLAEGAARTIDQALEGTLQQLRRDGELSGRKGEVVLVHTLGRLPAKRLALAGLGGPAAIDLDVLRDATATAARRARALVGGTLAIAVAEAPLTPLGEEAAAQAVVEGALLGLYRFDRYQHPTNPEHTLDKLLICGSDRAALERAIERGRIIAEAATFARDLANEPSNVLTPTAMADRARALALETGVDCEILDQEAMAALGMGALLGVAQGSHQPPRLIVLRYRGGGAEPGLGWVGKGITFDTGGISIKPAENMQAMKQDMSGGAAVIAAVGALARLHTPINVTAIVPATENMPGGNAIKPGDVLTAMNGKTIEVINTDAEGRLILADALSYARHLHLAPLVDVATLTGACAVALGSVAFGLMTNDAALADELRAASRRAGEKLWQLPMFEEYDELIKSPIADMKNTGGRYAGAITAAKFLARFAEETPWAHLDIAGVDDCDKDQGVLVKGATGAATRTLIHFALARAERAAAAPPVGSAL